MVAEEAVVGADAEITGDKPIVSSALEARWWTTVIQDHDNDYQAMPTGAAGLRARRHDQPK